MVRYGTVGKANKYLNHSKNMRRVISILVIFLLIFTSIPLVSALRHPVGIAGYVIYNGEPVQGATVIVTNLATGENDTATTDKNGLFIASLYGADNDILEGVVVYDNQTGSNQTIVNLNYTTQWLNISIGGALVARFTYYPSNPVPNEPVKFIDLSSGNPVQWLWDFGDGTKATGKNPTHKFAREGDYKVTLTIRDAGGNSDSTSKIVKVRTPKEQISIPPIKPPVYPKGYTIEEMCRLTKILDMDRSNDKVRVIFIDTGVIPRTYQVNQTMLDLSVIKRYTVLSYAEDDYGHGTAIGAILLYILQTKLDNFELISIKALDEHGVADEETFLKAMDLAEKLNPDVISISAGALFEEKLERKAEELVRKGIVVVASAGNYGPSLDTIMSPARNRYVIAVGADNPMLTILNLDDDTVPEWSSRGSKTLRKPDLVAPGESIRLPWGKTQEKVMSGTSFSAPFVAGGVAVAIAKNRGLYDLVKMLYFWDRSVAPNAVRSAVKETCYPRGIYYIWGAGILQCDKLSEVLHAKLMYLLVLFVIIIVIIVAVITGVIYVIRKRYKRWY